MKSNLENKSLRQAIEAIDLLVDSDFALDLEGWGLGPEGEFTPVEERKCDLKLLAIAQRVIGDIYCITHSELGTCSGRHEDWKQRKHDILAKKH